MHRSPGKSAKWWITGFYAVLGGAAAGATAGALVGALGTIIPASVRASIGVLVALALVASATFSRIPVPQIRRETEQRLLERGPNSWAFLNGTLLGFAVTSRIAFWSWYVVPLTCLATGSPASGATIWGIYGTSRMATSLILATRMRRKPETMSDIVDRLISSQGRMRMVTDRITVVLAAALFLGIGL